MDDDNLAIAFKAARDEIAAALGVDDGSERIQWRYQQVAKGAGVLVRIERGSDHAKDLEILDRERN